MFLGLYKSLLQLVEGGSKVKQKYADHIRFLTSIGFNEVSLYEDIGQVFYSALQPSGNSVEVRIDGHSVAWRELKVYPEEWHPVDNYKYVAPAKEIENSQLSFF
jgi:hypothetical protein